MSAIFALLDRNEQCSSKRVNSTGFRDDIITARPGAKVDHRLHVDARAMILHRGPLETGAVDG
jgi:uncharacterized RmlC-like cupin family protein